MGRIMRWMRAPFVAAVIVLIGALSRPADAAVSFDFFYSNLGSHGSWMVSGQYGRVWQPGVYAPGWNPYSDGHWVYSDLGWTWVSDYDWGAIPYHYGTWVTDPALGWVWVPGYVWAPSWVVFRTGPDFIGWAPVTPGFSVGVSIGSGAPPATAFTFVACQDFLAPQIGPRAFPASRTTVIVNHTTVVNNISVQNNVVVNRGPDVSWVERTGGHKVAPVPIESVSRAAPGGKFTRSDIGVGSVKGRQGLRAAEPVSASTPLPAAAGREAGTRGAAKPQARPQAHPAARGPAAPSAAPAPPSHPAPPGSPAHGSVSPQHPNSAHPASKAPQKPAHPRQTGKKPASPHEGKGDEGKGN